MTLNLNELRSLCAMIDPTENNDLVISACKMMFVRVIEPINQGIYEMDGIEDRFDSSYFQNAEDIVEGINFLERLGIDMTEQFELEIC